MDWQSKQALRDNRKRVHHCLVDSPYSEKKFLTIDDLVKIFSLETVRDVVLPGCCPEKGPDDYTILANQICGKDTHREQERGDTDAYDRILAILTLMEKEHMITDFIDNGLTNGRLPWSKTKLPISQSRWQDYNTDDFVSRQWQVLAPVLGPKEGLQACDYRFPGGQLMPFTEVPGTAPKDGGYGTVTIVTVPGEAHNRFAGHSVRLSAPLCWISGKH